MASPLGLAALAAVAACLILPMRSYSQQNRRNKLPGINKITSSGPGRQAFTGSVQSLDRQHHVLDVSAAKGQSTAIFPIRKNVKVSSIDGQKLKLASLTPGTNVIIYFEQKSGRRTVEQIIVLTPSAPAGKKDDHSS
ncbi:MAG TPA: hypothetical protein VFZ08_07595 [Terriglobia bacterium]|nr:hypothetical protein [Terriglobia bacterium]